MKLFGKYRTEKLTAGQQAKAGRIAERIISNQRSIADWLNGRTAHLKPRKWLVLLALFCLLFGTYCFYLLIAAFI